MSGPTISLGTRFRTIISQAPTIPFDAGNTRSVELPRSFPYKMLRARLRGSCASAAATAGLINESPLGIIKKFDIIADGRKVLVSAAGPDLYRLSNLFQGKAGEKVPMPTGFLTTRFSAGFAVHHEAARMLSPIMSYFDPRPYEKVEARVQWGTTADAFTTPSTAAIGAETGLDLQLIQSAEGSEQIAFNRLMFFDEFNFGAAPVTNFAINVPRAGLLAGIHLRVHAAGVPTNAFFQAAAAASSNVQGAIALKSDNNFLHYDSVNPSELQSGNAYDYALDDPQGAGNIGVPPAGYYYLDLTEDGLMTSLLNTYDLNVLQLLLTSEPGMATAVTVRVTYVFYEPITAA